MRTLVLGAMPRGATPQTHLASGPWCFAGREDSFPGWDGCPPPGREAEAAVFPLPDDPYPDARSMEAEARAANGEVLRLTRLLGEEFDARCGGGRSESYWQMALGPFLLPAVHMLAERQRRVSALLSRHGGETLRVDLLPESMPFCFRSTLDFMLHGIQDVTFNHYVFSRIVEAALAAEEAKGVDWRIGYLNEEYIQHIRPLDEMSLPRPGGKKTIFIRRLLRDLPFPRYKGFSLAQALLLSLAVLGNRGKEADRSLDFSLYGAGGIAWRFPAEKLIRACLPLDLRNGLRSGPRRAAKSPARPGGVLRPFQKNPLRGMTPAFSQDDAYRLRLAALRESGCRLFCAQHGANYGNLLSVGILPFEYGQHAFFTWGWSRHEGQPANALPLPHPALAAICGRHRERAPRLILVGTEMSTCLYRLKSRPQAGALLSYRAGKIIFFRTLLEAFRARTKTGGGEPDGRALPAAELLYRPYFKVAGGLDDGEHLLRHLPGIGLCAGDLTVRLLGCRLLVLDHYGTTLHMALAADVPTLAFWNRREWGMEAESERALDALQEAGVLHSSPEEAALRAAKLWDDPSAWWKSPPVRKARALWLDRYARVGAGADRPWGKLELTLHWFRALREL